MTEKKKTTKKPAAKKPAEKKVTASDRKKILQEEAGKLEKAAQKVALKAMAEMQLATQVELTPVQKEAAHQLSSGYNFDEVAEELGLKRQEIVAWMAQPAFAREVNERTVKHGASDKNERIRVSKRIHDEVFGALLERIQNEDLKNMPIASLNDILLKWSARMDSLVDKKEETTKKDLTVLILGHVQEKNQGKNYNNIDDFLNDPEFKYATAIDVEAEEVSSD